MDSSQESGRTVRDCHAVYLRAYYVAESGAADSLKAPLATESESALWDLYQAMALAETEIGLTFPETQEKAVGLVVTETVAVVTGGTGTRKTTILKAVPRRAALLPVGDDAHAPGPWEIDDGDE
ncbi:MAG: hypothetical protein O3A93_06040 [Chloroflexi bacterium]|nr:hypothetical protein [Chloroflexota bacterium]MDA1270802.1 hypothetical protein [Chloroflexota bacterium]